MMRARNLSRRPSPASISSPAASSRSAPAPHSATDRRDGARPRPNFSTEATDTPRRRRMRSEEHTSELQSLMRTSYAVFCLNKKIEHQDLRVVDEATKNDV